MSKRLHSTRVLALVAALALAAGAGATWAIARQDTVSPTRGLALAHELEMAGLCANALALMDSTADARLSAVLQQRLQTAVQQATLLVDNGARLGITAPHLRDSVRRAAAYYEHTQNFERMRDAERLLESLTDAM